MLLAAMLAASCGGGKITYRQVSAEAPVFPDYRDITVPCNIAPLNFRIDDADRITVLVKGRSEWRYERRGGLMRFPEKRWREMLAAERGGTVEVFVGARFGSEDRGWRGFTWTIAEEPVDRCLSFRLIEPAYEVWNRVQICERDVTCFDERLLADNNTADRSCINCHTSNKAAEPATFMHVRGSGGGTFYARGGRLRKIDTRTERTAGAVYGEIERSGRYGVFTTADIVPILHADASERMEVYDRCSDLIAIDFEAGAVSDSPAVSGPEYQETFPCFSSDGATVYFCRAVSRPQPDSTLAMRYSLCAVGFEDGRFCGEVRTVIDADSAGRSFSFPKCSPDGRRLLLTVADYGTFPIWHSETDLWMLDLETGRMDTLPATNGRYSDSYHSWSSNSRWIVFASKRGDRVYGRPYFAYVAEDGTVGKPFVLPQRDPDIYRSTLKSFNIPELYPTPEIYDARTVARAYFDCPAEKTEYRDR